jgi:hypothetical protein
MSSSILENQRIQAPSVSSIETSSLVTSEQIIDLTTTSSISIAEQLPAAQNDPLIERYFRSDAQGRSESRRTTALRIKTIEAVFLVLEWSQRGDIDYAYDAAVDLLAECEIILLKALQYLYMEYPRAGVNRLKRETQLDALISGLARASRLSFERRLIAITTLMSCESRIVKTAVIDAIAMLEHKKNKKQIRGLLEWFTSAKQIDNYVREYAKEALEDLE